MILIMYFKEQKVARLYGRNLPIMSFINILQPVNFNVILHGNFLTFYSILLKNNFHFHVNY